MTNRRQGFQSYRSMLVSALAVAAPLLACSGGNPELPGAGEGELLGEAQFELSTVPAGAVCMEVVAVVGTGAPGSGTYKFPLTLPAVGASTANVLLGKLPLGSVSLSANVYSVACASIATASADWIADAQTVDFRPGQTANISLTFRAVNPVRANVNFVGNITKLFAGSATTALVMSDGTARVAGNWSPLIGGLTLAFSPYSGVANIDELATGASHGCLLSTDGSVRCFGSNSFGQVGPNGGAGTMVTTTPVLMPAGFPGMRHISVGANHNCGVQTTGEVWCWGAGTDGQLGNGANANSATPVQAAISRASDVVAGANSTCANQLNGGLVCWGGNAYGQLGDGTTASRPGPGAGTVGLQGVVAFDVGSYHACAVRADGTLRCWGHNGNLALGDGTSTSRLTPTVVPGITDAVQVATATDATCALRQAGNVSCWGTNDKGQLGDGTTAARATPGFVAGLSEVTAIAAGAYHFCALQRDRKVLCWGLNESGQTGVGSLTPTFKPTVAALN